MEFDDFTSKKQNVVIYDIDINEKGTRYNSFIADALEEAEIEKVEISSKTNESIETINKLTPQCDKTDYALAVSSGVICGLLDIFLVGKPGESAFGEITDKWYKDKVNKFCKLNGCSNLAELEEKYIVPYDQTTGGPAFKEILNMTPSNHHYKSLAHNPSLLGLFFSILDQFSSPHLSHFVSNGELITLVDSDSGFVLRGNNIITKFFCAFANWIGHLISDVSGSSSSKGRGMGLPSPLWTWSNDVIAIKRSLNIKVSSFEKQFNDLAMNMYLEGYDLRFQTAQGIPVFINEMVTRLFYAIRRLIQYLSSNKGNYSFKNMWKECEPFANASVKRMLTVAHGTFCVVDIADVLVRSVSKGGGYAFIYEMCIRLNVIGLGRFSISLIGEASRAVKKNKEISKEAFYQQRKAIIESYIDCLEKLSLQYNDQYLLTFVNDLKNSECLEIALEKSAKLSEQRGGNSLKTMDDIDSYFIGDKKDE